MRVTKESRDRRLSENKLISLYCTPELNIPQYIRYQLKPDQQWHDVMFEKCQGIGICRKMAHENDVVYDIISLYRLGIKR